MQVINYIMIAMAIIAAIDRVIGNRFGLGAEFEHGIRMIAPVTLSMAGMLVVAPYISHLLMGVASSVPTFFDFSVIPSALIANDMGGAHLALSLAENETMGYYNGLILGSMLGCTVSFTLPFVLGATDKKHHKNIIVGILCGIITVPVGCIVGGLIAQVPFVDMLLGLVVPIILSALIAVGILKFEKITVKIFVIFGWLIKLIITFGLIVGIVEFLTGYAILPYMSPFPEVFEILVNIVCVMAGAFPLLFVLRKLLEKPFAALGRLLGINSTAVSGLFFTMGNSVTTFETVDSMDERGVILNSAFAVSGSFVFIDHLAFTLSFNSDYVPAMVAAKLVAGVLAVAFACFFLKLKKKKAHIG